MAMLTEQSESMVIETNLSMETLNIQFTELETQRLSECENIIRKGINTFIEVGNALMEIRDKKLYRITHLTFDEYCRNKWDMSRPRAYQLIEAVNVINDLSTIVDILPENENQTRALSKLEPELQREVWEHILSISEIVSTKTVHTEVQKVRELNNVLKEIKKDYKFENDQELLNKAREVYQERKLSKEEVLKAIKELPENERTEINLSMDYSVKNEINQIQDNLIREQKQTQALKLKINELELKARESELLKVKLNRFEATEAALFTIADLESRQNELFSDQKEIKSLLKVFDEGVSYFNHNIQYLGNFKVRESTKEKLEKEILNLVEVIDNWKFAVCNNLLPARRLQSNRDE